LTRPLEVSNVGLPISLMGKGSIITRNKHSPGPGRVLEDAPPGEGKVTL
jgi:hypothetical protein